MTVRRRRALAAVLALTTGAVVFAWCAPPAADTPAAPTVTVGTVGPATPYRP